MIWLLLCISANILLAIIFKAFQRYGVDNLNAITINYGVCVGFASIVLGKFAFPLDLLSKPWAIWAFVLALLFISGFNILALSFQKSGVALTAIIQKMSLIIPAAFAIVLYGEPLTWLKGAGIFAALGAVVFVNFPSKENGPKFSFTNPIIILPLLTFVMSGIIEIILFYVEVEGLVADEGILFTATSFGMAGILGAIYSFYRGLTQKIWPGWKELAAGLSLSIPNFSTIFLLIFLLSKGWQGSILFPVNSVSILIGTALLGFILYKEKADLAKIVGIALGIIAIVLISNS